MTAPQVGPQRRPNVIHPSTLQAPDTGSLRGDLAVLGRTIVADLGLPASRTAVPGLLADLADAPQLREHFHSVFIASERSSVPTATVSCGESKWAGEPPVRISRRTVARWLRRPGRGAPRTLPPPGAPRAVVGPPFSKANTGPPTCQRRPSGQGG